MGRFSLEKVKQPVLFVLFVILTASTVANTYGFFAHQTSTEKKVEILWQAKVTKDAVLAEIRQERADIATERGMLLREHETMQRKIKGMDQFIDEAMKILKGKVK